MLLTASFVGARADAQNPPICTKFRNTLSQCEVTPQLSNNSTCTGSTPCTEAEEEQGLCVGGAKIPWVDHLAYNEARYGSTDPVLVPGGQTAVQVQMRATCRNYAEVMSVHPTPNLYTGWAPGDPLDVEVLDPEYGICLIDRDGDGQASSFADRTEHVELVYLTPDDHCFLTPKGPYHPDNPHGLIGGGATYGGRFNTSSETWKNKVFNAQFNQKYSGPLYPTVRNIFTDAGAWRNSAWGPASQGLDYFWILQKSYPSLAADGVEFDHIIPRKDSQGCDCGINSYANVALISRKLNREMSNNVRHPARKALLAKYAPN